MKRNQIIIREYWTLQIRQGLIQYEINKTTFQREYFCSYPDRVLAMRFSAE